MIRPRVIIAFLIAPAIVPVIAGIFMTIMYHPDFGLGQSVDLPATFDYPERRYSGFVRAAGLSAPFAYAGALLVGVPAYLVLQRLHQLTITHALIVGMFAGAFLWIQYQRSTKWMCIFGEGIVSTIDDTVLYTGAISPGAILGLAVAALFWLIARPDRT